MYLDRYGPYLELTTPLTIFPDSARRARQLWDDFQAHIKKFHGKSLTEMKGKDHIDQVPQSIYVIESSCSYDFVDFSRDVAGQSSWLKQRYERGKAVCF